MPDKAIQVKHLEGFRASLFAGSPTAERVHSFSEVDVGVKLEPKPVTLDEINHTDRHDISVDGESCSKEGGGGAEVMESKNVRCNWCGIWLPLPCSGRNEVKAKCHTASGGAQDDSILGYDLGDTSINPSQSGVNENLSGVNLVCQEVGSHCSHSEGGTVLGGYASDSDSGPAVLSYHDIGSEQQSVVDSALLSFAEKRGMFEEPLEVKNEMQFSGNSSTVRNNVVDCSTRDEVLVIERVKPVPGLVHVAV